MPLEELGEGIIIIDYRSEPSGASRNGIIIIFLHLLSPMDPFGNASISSLILVLSYYIHPAPIVLRYLFPNDWWSTSYNHSLIILHVFLISANT